jgi:hypothetical protein
MMEITLMVMDAAEIVMSKLDFHAMVDLQAQEIHVQLFFHLLFQLNQEAKPDFMEKLY